MFKLIQGTKGVDTSSPKLERRLRALPTYQVQGWADAYLNEIGQYLLLNAREGGPEPLQRAEESATALLAAIRELRTRP